VAAEFFIHNLGCKVNRVESDTICAQLLAAGGKLASRDAAGVIVINSCTVTAEADTKVRKAIRQAHDAAKKPWVIVTGCAVAINRQIYKQFGDRVIIEPDRVAAQQKALELLGILSSDATPDQVLIRCSSEFRTRLGVKIQDGCNNSCTYCVVPAARGEARSEPAQSVLNQVQIAEKHGVGEIVLTGVNLGAYTSDDTDIAEVIRLLLASTERLRIRLSSLEPQYLTDELLELMAASEGRLCAHVHLPLQSGCDKTLQEMFRHYDCEFFEARVNKARNLLPHIAITTDVMVAFPGESDSDFAESLDFCRRMKFSHMHIFRYSRRPGTTAATRKDQISPAISKARAETMRELAYTMEQRDLKLRVGTTEAVLVESDTKGRSESYHQVLIPDKVKKGSLISMKFTDYRDNLLTGLIL